MRVLILWADDQSANLGVRVLAQGTVAWVRSVWPDAEVEFQNFGQRNPHLPIGRLTSIARERLTGRHGMRNWLAEFDLVVDTRAGDSFADIYGLGRLRTMSAVSEFATQAGTPVVLGPQTIGPFTTRQGLAIGKHSLRRAALSMSRDTASTEYSRHIRRPVSVQTTDVVFALPQPVPGAPRDVLLNVSGLLWQASPHVDWRAYRAAVEGIYRSLVADGRRVSLLAHVLDSKSPDNDVPALREFAAAVDPDVEIVVPDGLDAARSAIASASLVIASRMHACLNALSVGTAAVPLAYSRKFKPLLSDLGWNHTVDLRSSDDPVSAALASVSLATANEAAAVRPRADALLSQAASALASVA